MFMLLSKLSLLNRYKTLNLKAYNNYQCYFVKYIQSEAMAVTINDAIRILKSIAPLNLAEGWDNVGLLVEPSENKIMRSLLLTIDLTEDVVDEAIENKCQLIVAYHPNIFKPLKSVNHAHWKQRIIIKCIKNDIAVFSPHTSWDSMRNGVNDWLSTAFEVEYSKPININANDSSGRTGIGRYITLQSAISLKTAIELVKELIGLPYVRVGVGRKRDLDSYINSVAICAGSGTSVLSGVKADLYLTGEMLHHDVLEATQQGINVILCNHSDSERGFLKYFQKKYDIEGIEVKISKVDRDCLQTM
ncbi:NIF3-like protein 1 [Diabrotica undecimpunctata]|uniref:NIF3-like protein 1 n=1 Tax=Diabrotica undecimpunctata TaxID=50387 RepID=UPI003B63952A